MNNFAKTVILASIVILASVVIVSADADAVDPNATAIDDQADLTSAFTDGGSYYLTTNIECGSVTASETQRNPIFTVASGVTVTLDLSGHKITASIDSNNNSYGNCQIILNQGVLNIIDSTGGGSIENTNADSYPCTRTVKNDTGATLDVSDVTISSASAVAILNLGTCTIGEGSNITALREGFSGGWSNTCAAIENRGTDTVGGVLNVNGGTISSASQNGIYTDNDYSTTIITAGIVNGGSSYGAIGGSSADTTVHIRGGSFSSDVSMMVDDGYYVAEAGGRYVVHTASPSNPTVTTEEALISAIPDDDSIAATITLGADITLSQSVTVPRNTTIVVSPGITLTVSDVSVINLQGTIDNSGDLIIEGYVSNLFSITGEGTISVTSQPSEDGTYEISTAMELQWLAYLMDENPDRVWNVQLVDNIRIPDGVTFIMLGTTADDSGYISFNGTFDGNGHEISGIVMSSTGTPLGLFHSLQNAEVSDLTLDVDMTTNTGYIGGLAAYSAGGVTVDNVTINGNVTVAGTSYGSGGLFGSIYPSGDTEIISCIVNANVGGVSACNVGGIYGTCENTVGNIGIYNCELNGNVSSTGSSRGFVFGWGHMTSGKITIIGFTNGSDDQTLSYCPSVGTDADFTVDDDHIGSEYDAVVGPDGNWTYRGQNQPTVAKIGSVEFTSLAGAVAYATDGDTIVLQSDITDEPLTIGQDKNIILDLNGFTLSSSTDYTITNNGILTIRDSSGSTGTITRSTDGIVIENNGTLTLESGKVTRVSSTSSTPNYIIESSGTLNITGGTVEAATSMSSLIRSIGKSGSFATINISGGEIHQTDGIIAVKNDDYSILTVTGGTITCEYSGTDVEQAILNWSTANLKGGIINGSVLTWGYDDVQTDHTTAIDGPVTVNGSLYAINYDSTDTYLPHVTVSNGTITGQLYTRSGNSGGTEEPDAKWIQINGGTFSNPPENRFLADNYALTAVDGGYGVVPGFPVTVSIMPAGVTPVITITAENTMEYTYVEGLCLPNGEYKYSSTADGYYTTTGTFIVSDAGVNVSVTMMAEGQKIPVIIQYPSESGFEPVTFEVDINTTLDVAMIPVEDGFRIDPESLNGVGPITGPTTIDVNLILMSPTIESFTVTYEDGVAYITVSATHPADGAVLMYSIGGTPYVTDNVLTVAESGTYTLAVGAIVGSMSSETVATEDVIVTIPSGPDYPIIDDDDDYVPPIYVPSDTSSSDDDTVKIVACAAAAVVAAIMAAFLILGHRRE